MNKKPFGKRTSNAVSDQPEKASPSDWLGLGLLVGIIGSIFTTDYWMPAADGFVGFICRVIEFSDIDPEIWALRSSYTYSDTLGASPINSSAIGWIIAIAVGATFLLCIAAHYKTKKQFNTALNANRRSNFGLN